VVLLLLSSQSKSKVSKMRKNQRTKLVIQPNFTESGHHCALLITHVSCPPAARIRLSPRRLCLPHLPASPGVRLPPPQPVRVCLSLRRPFSPHVHARLTVQPPRPALARVRPPQPTSALLAPCVRLPHPTVASPCARTPPASARARLARRTRAHLRP
jgi:hypothetical protein